MKKLLPALIIALFAIKVNAQAPLTRELTCTEEAFTLRLSLKSGWHPGIVKIGSAEVANYVVPAQIDYLALRDNAQKSEALNQLSIFHADGLPGLDQGHLLFNKKPLSDFGLHSEPIYKYRDSMSFLHSYK